MSDTQNKWVSVSQRLPETLVTKLVVTSDDVMCLAYARENGTWWTVGELKGVTHWMDLPELPPKPADPFEAWWWLNRNAVKFCMGDARLAWDGGWDAAREHYAKPLPDFETWWDWQDKGDLNHRWREIRGIAINYPTAKAIWNAAQGKPEA